jgi:hypothetical protein
MLTSLNSTPACDTVRGIHQLHQSAPQPRDARPAGFNRRHTQAGGRSTRRSVIFRGPPFNTNFFFLLTRSTLALPHIYCCQQTCALVLLTLADWGETVDPHPEDVFRAALVELAQDLITKEQQIELLISILPGLDNSEQDQERNIRELEEELKVAEAQRQEAIKEREQTLAKLDTVIRSIRRP